MPKINIPRADEKEVVKIPSGKSGFGGDIKNRFDKIDQILYGVMFAVVLAMIAIIISVIGIFLDQMRANNAIYKEYSQKTEVVEKLGNTNKVLIEQSLENQKIILEIQKQVLEIKNNKK